MEESKNGRRDPPGARGGQRGVRWADLDGRSPLEHSARCALLPEENAILLRVVSEAALDFLYKGFSLWRDFRC